MAQLVGEPLRGTAPQATAWLAIEQHGPFGHDALRQSHFPKGLADELPDLLAGTGIRVALIRPVGRHADVHEDLPNRRVFIASSTPGRVALASADITDPRELLGLDIESIAAGHPERALHNTAKQDGPLLLVCTHAKRDVCCALAGRPLAAALASDSAYSDLVWETSHLGGHRFAATAVQLPHGWVFGRLDLSTATEVLDRAGEANPTVPLTHARGRSCLEPQAQAADLAAREDLGISAIDATRVVRGGPDSWNVFVDNAQVAVVQIEVVDLDRSRPESCGAALTAGSVFKTTIL